MWIKMILRGHDRTIRRLIQLSDGRVISGSQDKTLRIWNIETGECERVLRGHRETVSCLLKLSDGRVISGSEDKTLRIWNVPNKPYIIKRAHDIWFTFN